MLCIQDILELCQAIGLPSSKKVQLVSYFFFEN
jgi:hypothetical protein